MRNVFLDYSVEVGATETKSAQTGAARAICRNRPRFQLRIHVKGRVSKVDVGVGTLAVHAGRNHLVAKRQCEFQQSSSAGCALKVSNIRFDRADGHRMSGQMETAEGIGHALHLNDVAHASGGAMALDVGRSGRRQPGILPSALNSKLLAYRIWRSNAFSFAVAGCAHPAQHGIDFVSVAFGVSQTLEQENRCAFAHYEAVGSFRIGTRSGSRERTDLAELYEGRSPHVAVNAARDGRIEIVLNQSLDCGGDCRHCRRAGCVHNVVRSMEVVDIGNPTGDAVGQFAGHAVFRDLRQVLRHPVVHLAGYVPADCFRQRGETGTAGQFPGVFREIHT